jgi:hypothetical protein
VGGLSKVSREFYLMKGELCMAAAFGVDGPNFTLRVRA